MRYRHIVICILLMLFNTPSLAGDRGGELPTINGRLNDHANILSRTDRNQLYQLLAQFEFSKNYHVVLLTVESIEDSKVEDYARQLWPVMEHDKSAPSVLILLSRDEKTGTILADESLGKVLSEAAIQGITRSKILSNMQQDNYSEAAMGTVLAVLGELAR